MVSMHLKGKRTPATVQAISKVHRMLDPDFSPTVFLVLGFRQETWKRILLPVNSVGLAVCLGFWAI